MKNLTLFLILIEFKRCLRSSSPSRIRFLSQDESRELFPWVVAILLIAYHGKLANSLLLINIVVAMSFSFSKRFNQLSRLK